MVTTAPTTQNRGKTFETTAVSFNSVSLPVEFYEYKKPHNTKLRAEISGGAIMLCSNRFKDMSFGGFTIHSDVNLRLSRGGTDKAREIVYQEAKNKVLLHLRSRFESLVEKGCVLAVPHEQKPGEDYIEHDIVSIGSDGQVKVVGACATNPERTKIQELGWLDGSNP